MVSVLRAEFLPALLSQMQISLIRQVPSNTELFEPEAALNEGFLNKFTHKTNNKQHK